MKQKIMNIITEAFENNIRAEAFLEEDGKISTHIIGKEGFLLRIRKQLDKIVKEDKDIFRLKRLGIN